MANCNRSVILSLLLFTSIFLSSGIASPATAHRLNTVVSPAPSQSSTPNPAQYNLSSITSDTGRTCAETYMIPINMSLFLALFPSGPELSGAVTVSEVPASGGNVFVGCDHPELVSSPSGSWPYSLSYPAGGPAYASFSCSIVPPASSTTVTMFSCPSGADPNDPSQWSVVGTITLQPG